MKKDMQWSTSKSASTMKYLLEQKRLNSVRLFSSFCGVNFTAWATASVEGQCATCTSMVSNFMGVPRHVSAVQSEKFKAEMFGSCAHYK